MSERQCCWREIEHCLIRKCHVSSEVSSEVLGLGTYPNPMFASEFKVDPDLRRAATCYNETRISYVVLHIYTGMEMLRRNRGESWVTYHFHLLERSEKDSSCDGARIRHVVLHYFHGIEMLRGTQIGFIDGTRTC
jgi:hypothetical protein